MRCCFEVKNGVGDLSAKCIFITGSLWECLGVVGPESQGGQIPEFTIPMQWPSGAPGSTWECWQQDWECKQQAWKHRQQAWEHLESQYSILGKTPYSLGTLMLRLEIIATIDRSTIFKTHVFHLYSHLCIYVSMYQYSYPSTNGISRLAAGSTWQQFEVRLKLTIEWTQGFTWRPWSWEFRYALGRHYYANFEAMIKWT